MLYIPLFQPTPIPFPTVSMPDVTNYSMSFIDFVMPVAVVVIAVAIASYAVPRAINAIKSVTH